MASPSSENKLLCTFYTSSLYQNDLNLLEPKKWLNDSVIQFCYDIFQYQKFASLPACFCAPGSAFILAHEEDKEDLENTVLGLELAAKELVFFPINDNEDVEVVGGGMHWSLLVWNRGLSKFFYVDSARAMNLQAAALLAHKLIPFLRKGLLVSFLCAVLFMVLLHFVL